MLVPFDLYNDLIQQDDTRGEGHVSRGQPHSNCYGRRTPLLLNFEGFLLLIPTLLSTEHSACERGACFLGSAMPPIPRGRPPLLPSLWVSLYAYTIHVE